MKDLIELVTNVVALNGGTMVGKTRLQKTFYLLESAGLCAGIEFDYHHYGPYSAEVAIATDFAVMSGGLVSKERPGYHQVPYTIFSTDVKAPNWFGSMPADAAREKLALLGSYSALELEIAATILYVEKEGLHADPIEEVKRLKPLKATSKRVRRAQNLIDGLGLSAKAM
jgi:uncharacterized protein